MGKKCEKKLRLISRIASSKAKREEKLRLIKRIASPKSKSKPVAATRTRPASREIKFKSQGSRFGSAGAPATAAERKAAESLSERLRRLVEIERAGGDVSLARKKKKKKKSKLPQGATKVPSRAFLQAKKLKATRKGEADNPSTFVKATTSSSDPVNVLVPRRKKPKK
jgi:hypothetical protein